LSVAIIILCRSSVSARELSKAAETVRPSLHLKLAELPRPDPSQAARMARWLAHTLDWGTLAVTRFKDHTPIAGAVSFSDGRPDSPSGRLFFYLTPMDELLHNLHHSPSAAFTVTEAQRLPQGCGATDPEDPTCAKATFLGTVAAVPEPDLDLSRQALFSRHPAMASWPEGHGFACYELHVAEVHLLDYYGGMKVISSQEYYGASPEDLVL